MLKADPVDGALDLWPDLANLAGLPGRIARFWRISARSGATTVNVVVGIEPEGTARRVILKRDLRPDNHADGHFARALAAQEQAHRRFAGDMRGLGVPRLLAFLPQAGVALFEEAPGLTAAAILEDSDSNAERREVLELAARWLAGFHGSAPGERRPYHPQAVTDHLQNVRSAVNGGRTVAAEPHLLIRLIDAILDGAHRHEGHPALHAARHGNYNLRNLLIAREGVTSPRLSAIDFRPAQVGPVGHDVARILVDFAALHAEHQKVPDGALLQPAYMNAFFRSYDFSRPTRDAAIAFLPPVQIVQDWLRVPAAEADRPLHESIRLTGLIATAMRLFPDLRTP